MGRASCVLLLVAAVSLSMFAGLTPATPAPKEPARAVWEYKVVGLDPLRGPEAWEKQLNELGAEGWEVAGTATVGAAQNRVILKRPK